MKNWDKKRMQMLDYEQLEKVRSEEVHSIIKK